MDGTYEVSPVFRMSHAPYTVCQQNRVPITAWLIFGKYKPKIRSLFSALLPRFLMSTHVTSLSWTPSRTGKLLN